MKTIFLLVLLNGLLCVSGQASTKILEIDNNGSINIKGPRSEVPVVEYDDSMVIVSSNTLLYDVNIVIKNISGDVIYNENVVLGPYSTALEIFPEYQSEKYIIELYYDDKYLYGYFLR